MQLSNGEKKYIQDVKYGDIIVGHDEKPNKVLFTYEYDCDEEVVTLSTEDNKSLTMTKDHKVYAIKKEDFEKGIRQPSWYSMEELNEGDYLVELDD